MFPWSNAPAKTRFTVDCTVYSGACTGTVVSVDDNYVRIQWSDGEYGPITYPVEADYLRLEK